jgi:Pyridoxal-phosphate dependent enzyme
VTGDTQATRPALTRGGRRPSSSTGPVTLKLEQPQCAGSFKARGAFANLLLRDVPPPGVAAASGGNPGLAVAYAAHRLGIPARVFVPAASFPAKTARWACTPATSGRPSSAGDAHPRARRPGRAAGHGAGPGRRRPGLPGHPGLDPGRGAGGRRRHPRGAAHPAARRAHRRRAGRWGRRRRPAHRRVQAASGEHVAVITTGADMTPSPLDS